MAWQASSSMMYSKMDLLMDSSGIRQKDKKTKVVASDKENTL